MIRRAFVPALSILIANAAFAFGSPLGIRHTAAIVPAPITITFSDLSDLYGYIAQSRGLGARNDSELAKRIAASSRVVQVHDGSADPILVIKADVLDQGGHSRLRSSNGNYPFYVLRVTEDRLVLLGTMFGADYRHRLDGRQLRFEVRLRTGPHTTKAMTFLVDGTRLVNLSAPPLPPIASYG